jgi:histidine triad (HIT) family protein
MSLSKLSQSVSERDFPDSGGVAMTDCVFCEIVAGQAPALIVDEDEGTLSFLSIRPGAYGHTLIVPKAHYADLFDVPVETAGQLAQTAKRLALRYREKIGATGCNLLHASGAAGQQSVFHIHLHLLPRFSGDGIDAWPHLPRARAGREEMYERLRPD